MERKNWILEAAIIAAGLMVMGWSLKAGIDNFVNKDRRVTVKGLSEVEVPADKVTWPIVTKEIGNDLPTLYNKINHTTETVKAFLLKNGIKEEEISVNTPDVVDLNAQRWNNNERSYRYNITSSLTVTSKNVDLVRGIINRQSELLKEGIAIVGASDYETPSVQYEFTGFKEMKPRMMQEAIENAQKTAEQFAANSHSRLNKIVSADQGQFSIENRDNYTPYIKTIRVVSTVTYSLKN